MKEVEAVKTVIVSKGFWEYTPHEKVENGDKKQGVSCIFKFS